ncbi:MAG: hypothetical protein PHV82_05265 [Victivallaceae bacterium]|nr:hypothetical protein [Victivallaceae bacterium]
MKSITFEFVLGIAALIFIAGNAAAAENLLKGGDAEDASIAQTWSKRLTLNTEDKVSGKSSCLATQGSISAKSPEFIEIDPAKTYKLSGSFKSAGKDQGRCYLGLIMYDANKRLIHRNHITYKAGSQTKLAAEAKTGDTVIKLADCSKWDTGKLNRKLVAFGAKDDLSDLPNTDLSAPIDKLEKQGDIYEVTLTKPLKKDYPAGTEVREHYSTGGYQYCAAANKTVPNEWTKYSTVIKGIDPKGPSNKQFWPGTKYVKAIIIMNYRAKKDEDCRTLFDDIILEEVPDEK